jgi:hypothetical protein
MKSAEIMCFLRFSIARIHPELWKISPDFLFMVSVASQKYRRNFLKKLLSYLACSQIWSNASVDHRHFGYNTELPKEKKNTAVQDNDAKRVVFVPFAASLPQLLKRSCLCGTSQSSLICNNRHSTSLHALFSLATD